MEARKYEKPFTHYVVTGLVPPALAGACRCTLQRYDDPAWIDYDNQLESRKRAMECRDTMPGVWLTLLNAMESYRATEFLSDLLGVDLHPCYDRRGASIHILNPGGYLQTHLDYALHPSGMERRANAILFLDDADPQLGGGLQLCDPYGKPVTTLYPRAGEAVVWECSDLSYHAVEPLSESAPPRVTAACYYLARPRPGATRRRALYMPKR